MKKLFDKTLVKILVAFLRIGLGFLLFISSFHKIANPRAFFIIVENYQVLPDFLVTIVAACLPLFELIVGFCLIAGIWIEANAIIASLMFLSFAYGIGINLLRGRTFDCGCFGFSSSSELINWLSFFREIVLTGIAVFIFAQGKFIWTIGQLWRKSKDE